MADDERLRRAYRDAMTAPASPHVTDDAWEAMALGELDALRRDAVSRHVATCADCSAIYQSLRQLEKEARAFDAGVPVGDTPARASWPAWYAAAAAIALLAGGLLMYRQMTPPSEAVHSTRAPQPVMTLARIEVTPPEVQLSAERALATRGAGDQQAFLEAFGKAIEPYRSARYAEAAAALLQVADAYPAAYEPRFYHGVSSLLAGDAAAAIAAFERVRPLAPPALQDQIMYLRAAALQRNGDDTAARAALASLCGGSGDYRDRACALLK